MTVIGEDLFSFPSSWSWREREIRNSFNKEVLEKGFEDLRSMDLIDENDEPTEACMARGIYLDSVPEGFSHCEVDQQFCIVHSWSIQIVGTIS